MKLHVFFLGQSLVFSMKCRTGWCPEERGDLGWNTAGTVHRKRWQRKALLFGDIQLDCHITRCQFGKGTKFGES